jgi:hypothetical protein
VPEERPAFYALRPGGWRDLVTVLHPPYTAWNLANVCFGAAAATQIHTDRFIATLAAFFLAVGISAHTLDELNGRPLKTELSDRTLIALASASLAGAMGIGIAGCFIVSATLIPFVLAGGFFVVAYNLELFGGRFHNDVWFALAWGAFPLLTAYFVSSRTIAPETALAAVFAALLSHSQRLLSTPVREVRRHVTSVGGTIVLDDGGTRPVDATTLIGAPEQALRVLVAAVVTLAAALVTFRVT